MFSSLVGGSGVKFSLSERIYELQMIHKNHLMAVDPIVWTA